MDELDVRLLRAMVPHELGGGGFHPDELRSPRLARAVGLSVNAVKARLAALAASGLLQGVHVMPSLAVFGLGGGAYFLRAPDRRAKEQALRELDARKRLIRVHDYVGDASCVELAHAGAQDREEVLGILSRASSEPPLQFLVHDLPPPPRGLTPLDWRVLRALRRDPLGSPQEHAAEAGVSARTVKRRVQRLVAEGVLHAMPVLDPGRASGLLLVELLVWFRPGRDRDGRAEVLNGFERQRIFAYEPSSPACGHFNILAYAQSAAEVDELRRRAEAMPAVARAEAWLFASTEDRSAWIDELLEARAAAAPLALVQARPRGDAQP